MTHGIGRACWRRFVATAAVVSMPPRAAASASAAEAAAAGAPVQQARVAAHGAVGALLRLALRLDLLVPVVGLGGAGVGGVGEGGGRVWDGGRGGMRGRGGGRGEGASSGPAAGRGSSPAPLRLSACRARHPPLLRTTRDCHSVYTPVPREQTTWYFSPAGGWGGSKGHKAVGGRAQARGRAQSCRPRPAAVHALARPCCRLLVLCSTAPQAALGPGNRHPQQRRAEQRPRPGASSTRRPRTRRGVDLIRLRRHAALGILRCLQARVGIRAVGGLKRVLKGAGAGRLPTRRLPAAHRQAIGRLERRLLL